MCIATHIWVNCANRERYIYIHIRLSCTYVYICIYTCMYVYICVCISFFYVYMGFCLYVSICKYVYLLFLWIYGLIPVRAHLCKICISWMHICLVIYIYIYICICCITDNPGWYSPPGPRYSFHLHSNWCNEVTKGRGIIPWVAGRMLAQQHLLAHAIYWRKFEKRKKRLMFDQVRWFLQFLLESSTTTLPVFVYVTMYQLCIAFGLVHPWHEPSFVVNLL